MEFPCICFTSVFTSAQFFLYFLFSSSAFSKNDLFPSLFFLHFLLSQHNHFLSLFLFALYPSPPGLNIEKLFQHIFPTTLLIKFSHSCRQWFFVNYTEGICTIHSVSEGSINFTESVLVHLTWFQTFLTSHNFFCLLSLYDSFILVNCFSHSSPF